MKKLLLTAAMILGTATASNAASPEYALMLELADCRGFLDAASESWERYINTSEVLAGYEWYDNNIKYFRDYGDQLGLDARSAEAKAYFEDMLEDRSRKEDVVKVIEYCVTVTKM